MRYRIISDEVLQNCLDEILTRKAKGEIVNVVLSDDDKSRSTAQNRLQRQWLNDLERQGDMSSEEYRAFCKLHFGIPILRQENEKFRQAYDSKVKWRDYADKLMYMAEPFDFPVTRLMTVKQHGRFLDEMYTHFTAEGFELTDPTTIGLDRWQRF